MALGYGVAQGSSITKRPKERWKHTCMMKRVPCTHIGEHEIKMAANSPSLSIESIKMIPKAPMLEITIPDLE